MTTTGHAALATQCSLVEPINIPRIRHAHDCPQPTDRHQRLVNEDGRRMTFDDFRVHHHVGMSGPELLQYRLERFGHITRGIVAIGNERPTETGGPLPSCDDFQRRVRVLGLASGHSRAISDTGEPSIPATIRPPFTDWLPEALLVCSCEVISLLSILSSYIVPFRH